jgi:hypothetical protein
VHGDLWVNNLLWSNEEEPNRRVAAFIDWQMTVRGSPMVDVNRLLAMNTEPEVRHGLEREGNLLAFYLKSLNDRLAQSGTKPVGYGVEEVGNIWIWTNKKTHRLKKRPSWPKRDEMSFLILQSIFCSNFEFF